MGLLSARSARADRKAGSLTHRETLIDVENVSKRFCRSLKRSLWYGVQDITKELTGRGQEADDLRTNEFWALRDVSLKVFEGESLGLIGHNGAGKTTLLKLINGLIKPTNGKITVGGSVRALIALGTGFNPVLTGRENVRIAAAVLGYDSHETDERFEEIVAFAEIGEFIDAPVQSYSSGMLARLGFSVAVYTRPDILLVDEVLAVGDLNFAIKCHRKIAEFRDHGGSIILVSHNPYTIRTNCDRVVWMEKGTVQQIGDTTEVCDAYEMAVARQDSTLPEQQYRDGTVEVIDLRCPVAIQSGDEFFIELELKTARNLNRPILAVTFSTIGGQPVVSNVSSTEQVELTLDEGVTTVRLSYDSLPLVRGIYSISVVVAERYMNNQILALVNYRRVEVTQDPGDFGAGDFGAGVVMLRPTWDMHHDGVNGLRVGGSRADDQG